MLFVARLFFNPKEKSSLKANKLQLKFFLSLITLVSEYEAVGPQKYCLLLLLRAI